MSNVSTRVLKDQLSQYIGRAETGERIVVLRDGRPVAALVPLSDLPADDPGGALALLAARGLVRLPEAGAEIDLDQPLVPGRGRLASEMVTEDRR